MYKEMYAPLPDRAAYLERIGLKDEPMPVNAETLHKLVYAHLTHVPFENLDVFEKRITPNLGIEALFDKIVVRRRGGYCFEQNGLFAALMTALGYTVYPVVVRILRPGMITTPAHRGTVVVLPEGEYYVDVGFGGPASTYPVPLNGEKTPDGFYIVREDHNCVVCHEEAEGEDSRIFMFAAYPAFPVDFVPLNFHMAQWEESRFRLARVLNIRTEDGSCALTDDVLRIHKNGEVTEIKLETRTELLEAMKTYFGVVLDA